MKVYILGAQGWIPSRNETCCVMVEHKGELFILDAGTGAANIGRYTHVLAKYDTVNILFSHYHLDHTIGLIYLEPYLKDKHYRIYGPGRLAYPHSTEYYLHALLRPEFFSRGIERFSSDVEIFDFPAERFCIGGVEVRVCRQKHSAPSYRIALDDALIYATDTTFDAHLWQEVHARVLLHECWEAGDGTLASPASGFHSSLTEIMKGLPLKNFEQILLIHQNPAWSEADYEKIRSKISGSKISLARDVMELEV